MKTPDEILKEQILLTLNRIGVSLKEIILFGSRARGDFDKHSDYDILLITEKTFTIKGKMEIAEEIRDRLARLGIASDIIIKSEEEVEYFKTKIGSVVREALKEGIVL